MIDSEIRRQLYKVRFEIEEGKIINAHHRLTRLIAEHENKGTNK